MKILICGATGFVGKSLIPALLANQHQVTAMGRDTSKIQSVFKNQVTALAWDQLNTLSPDDFDAVINLAGETIAESRWTDKVKAKIKESRVKATQAIVDWCLTAKQKKPHLYNASAIGTYGLQSVQKDLPTPLTEAKSIAFGKPTDFLSEVGQAWESAADEAVNAGVPVTFLRFGVVLKRGEGMLKKLELPFICGLGSVLGTGQQAVTWVHIDDLVQAILFLLQHPAITGAVNICAPGCVSQAAFSAILAKTLHRPLFLTMPAWAVKILFGQMGEELLLGGQHIYPQRLWESGFVFTYPELAAALAHEWPA
jgi:uncharacterized protein (TIGR01777 family)